jgi:hypothetical protein
MNSENLTSITTEDVRDMLGQIIENNVPIRRLKKDGSFGFIPPEDFDLYLKKQDMTFYIDPENLSRLKSGAIFAAQPKAAAVVSQNDICEVTDLDVEPFEPDRAFIERIEKARNMSFIERIAFMKEGNNRLKAFAAEGHKFDAAAIDSTGKIFADTLCVNKVSFQENLENPHSPDAMKQLVAESYDMVDNLLLMLVKGKATFSGLAALDYIQTGSNSLDHMNRILIRFISFLFFYNSYFQKNSNEIKKFRARFKDRYADYYNKITNGSQKLSLEIVFKDGLAPVKNRSTFIEYAMTGLMHDIGKMPTVDYHDGDEKYDVSKARRHVFDGYNMLVMSKQFGWSTVASVLLHHDYYGAPYGYRQLVTFQKRFPDRRKEQRDVSVTTYFMSYNILDVAYNNSMAYFPIKVLEMLDVFDAMTDNKKRYRAKNYTPEGALREMRNQFLEGAYVGLDPILYNIFVDFLHTSGLVIDPGEVDLLKI